MPLGTAKGAAKYMIKWPAAVPLTAYKAGQQYSVIIGILAALVSLPAVPLVFLAEVVMSTVSWIRG